MLAWLALWAPRRRNPLVPFIPRLSVSSSTHILRYDPESRSQPPPVAPPRRPSRRRISAETAEGFQTWTDRLRPGFTAGAVEQVLRSQRDPVLALQIFRWAAQRRGYAHNQETYYAMIEIAFSCRRFRFCETLIREVMDGICRAGMPFYNAVLRMFCRQPRLMFCSFDVYRKMLRSEDHQPTRETYRLLLQSVVRRLDHRDRARFVYLEAVRALTQQMRACGVIPDNRIMNLIVKACSVCGKIDEATEALREMGIYGRRPNSITYGWLAKGFCERGRAAEGAELFHEMRRKGLVPRPEVFRTLVCGLSMARRNEEAVDVLFDMLDHGGGADLLTYQTLVKSLCGQGRGGYARGLLGEIRKRDASMDEETHRVLLRDVRSAVAIAHRQLEAVPESRGR